MFFGSCSCRRSTFLGFGKGLGVDLGVGLGIDSVIDIPSSCCLKIFS